MKKLCILGLLGVAIALTPACGDDDDDTDGTGGAAGEGGNIGGEGGAPLDEGAAACKELGSLCHDADDGKGLGKECHELGHVGDGKVCLARYDECKTYCESVLGQGGGSHGHGGGGGESHSEGGAGGEAH
jgi:hypothetical protein